MTKIDMAIKAIMLVTVLTILCSVGFIVYTYGLPLIPDEVRIWEWFL